MTNFYFSKQNKYFFLLLFLFISQQSSLTVVQDYTLNFEDPIEYVTSGQVRLTPGTRSFTKTRLIAKLNSQLRKNIGRVI